MWQFVMAAVLGLMVGATGPANADVIYTYSMNTNFCGGNGGLYCAAVKGSFSVDSAHFNATGITEIDSFMTDLSFTVTVSSRVPLPPGLPPVTIFDPSVGFLPVGVTVTPAGVLTNGSNSNEITSPLSGWFAGLGVGTESEHFVSVGFICCNGQPDFMILGNGDWTTTTTPMPVPVPEPATWALFGVGALMLAVYGQRRRSSSAKIAHTV
jgi:hypothetical protein